MGLEVQCPRCPATVSQPDTAPECPVHGRVVPLWRAVDPCYDTFTLHLAMSQGLPTWLPWPLPLGWQVTDFGSVSDGVRAPQASFASCGGPLDVDGTVEIVVVTEEPGVGLAARCGGVPHTDPGREVDDAPLTRIQVGGGSTALWAVSTSDGPDGAGVGPDGVLDRVVLAGEAEGRWLWLVLRPASAALALPQLGALVDVADLGPTLVSLPFGVGLSSW